MTRLEDLRILLERVERCSGPDREVDELICVVLFRLRPAAPHCVGDEPIFWDEPFYKRPVPKLTASVDAALSLVERVLPVPNTWAKGSPPSSGWKINFYRGVTPTGQPCASWDAAIRLHAAETVWYSAPTLPLAILTALLSALIARETAKEVA